MRIILGLILLMIVFGSNTEKPAAKGEAKQ
jgi:hypothetical protein